MVSSTTDASGQARILHWMNFLQPKRVPLPAATDGAGQFNDLATESTVSMSNSEAVPFVGDRRALDAHHDARAVIRLAQCPHCSYPLRTPTTLPCGNSLCRACLPETYVRENISYPNTPLRQQGFVCPFTTCGKEHSMADCSLDVTLSKLIDVLGAEIKRYRELTTDTPTLLEEKVHHSWDMDESLIRKSPRSQVLHGGRLIATYTLAEMGELQYGSEVSYQVVSEKGDDFQHLDIAVLEHLKEAARGELDCQVCYALMIDPLTTSCGHTFCRKCLARVLDHSKICPICRRTLAIPASLEQEPSNKRLATILSSICPDHVAAREEALAIDEQSPSDGIDTPLFVCTLSFPTMPTFLHVFEPRYRLMIRRAIESRDRKFGMVMYNPSGETPEGMRTPSFRQYGTLLHIVNLQMLADGRSLIETVGVSRFRVKNWDMLDGYTVGQIERVDDISLAEEERLEAAETSSEPVPDETDLLAQLDRLPTRELLNICLAFVTKMQNNAAPWLHQHVPEAYGHPPNDPALFPYWFASVLPISDEEKYELLPTRSVRERVKITARWVRRIEAQRWLVSSSVSSR
ncbi:MAG: hypothetical protein M1819_006472 [Sarea resinae]|nr:MAG: hypothetical protein M1819_006472 [Sarea resinae]